jgi:hypothetical protein
MKQLGKKTVVLTSLINPLQLTEEKNTHAAIKVL